MNKTSKNANTIDFYLYCPGWSEKTLIWVGNKANSVKILQAGINNQPGWFIPAGWRVLQRLNISE